jgi:drug/metabolite transporter (DMT)-like permease
MTTSRLNPILFALLAITWGSSYVAVRVGGETMAPFGFVAIRVVTALAALLVAGALLHTKAPPRDRWPAIAAVGLTGIVFPFLLITEGQRHVDVGLSSILGATTPLFGVVLAAAVVRDEPLNRGKVVGLVVGFGGVAVLVLGSGPVAGSASVSVGDSALIVIAAASAAVTGIIARRWLRGVSPLAVATGQALAAMPIIGALAVIEGLPASIPPAALASALWLGLVCSTAGPILYYWLIGSIGVGRTVMVNYLVPVVGVAGGALLLGEELGVATGAGGALVVGGIVVANVPSHRWQVPRLRVAGRTQAVPAGA